MREGGEEGGRGRPTDRPTDGRQFHPRHRSSVGSVTRGPNHNDSFQCGRYLEQTITSYADTDIVFDMRTNLGEYVTFSGISAPFKYTIICMGCAPSPPWRRRPSRRSRRHPD